MYTLDSGLLGRMGIEDTDFEFELPVYIRNQMTNYSQGGLSLYHSQPRPMSDVFLLRLVFLIKDFQKFLR